MQSVGTRKNMVDQTYHKQDIATMQLKTAVILFLNGKDCSSVITLAGAAGNILSQLVKNNGGEPFVDFACRVHDALVGYTPPRNKYKHHIDKELGVTAHKHMSSSDSEDVEIDLEKSAADSLIRALSDYTTLKGQEENFVKEFFRWAWKNMDGEEIMESYNKMPNKIKKVNGTKKL